MGADIDLYVEVRVGRVWHPFPEPRKGERASRRSPFQILDLGQSYELFTLLDGNPVGMKARLVDLPPLFGGRGFPEDMNPFYKKELPKWNRSVQTTGATPSWLELRELVELDWDIPVRHHSYVEAEYAGWFHPDKPFPQELSELWDARGLYHGLCGPPPAGTVRVEWSLSLREFVGSGEWFIEQLSALAPGAELRIIYWIG